MQVLRCDNVTEQEEDTIYICSNISGGYLTIDERSIMDFKISLSFQERRHISSENNKKNKYSNNKHVFDYMPT